MEEVIKLSYHGVRPYYVGFKSMNCPRGATTRTTHFDGLFDNRWYNAVARLVYEFMQEYPYHKFEYRDVNTVEMTANLSYEEVRKLILKANGYRNIRMHDMIEIFGEDITNKNSQDYGKYELL